jgi:CMP-N-acetylneuraminic acid synthetase
MILGVIPARKGSKGIKNKNIYPLCDKPLIDYTIEAAKNSNLDSIVITTNSNEIFDMYYLNDYTFIKRPENLCKDNTSMFHVIKHAFKTYNYLTKENVYAVMILQPTSPLRTTKDINKAINLFYNIDCDSLYSGYYIGIKHKNKTYDKHINKPHFQRNGAIFITRRDLLYQGKLWSDNAIEYIMPSYRSIDIDSLEDMKHAELLIKGGVLDV